MTTPLLEPVTRRTTLVVEYEGVKREVEVSLIPGNEPTATPPALSFHLVGLHEKSDKTVPLPMLLRLAGYKVKLWPAQPDKISVSEQIAKFFVGQEGA